MIMNSGADKSQPTRSHTSQDPPNTRHKPRHDPIEIAEEKSNLDMIIAYLDPAC
jgi:hypothetical protein